MLRMETSLLVHLWESAGIGINPGLFNALYN